MILMIGLSRLGDISLESSLYDSNLLLQEDVLRFQVTVD
jgi:hypothetical protein